MGALLELKSTDIEILLAEHFGYRANIVVPNVWWGWGLRHEADMIVLRPSGFVDEVEIKTSWQDLKADGEKRWDHWESGLVSRVWFAAPQLLAERALTMLDPRYGIKSVWRRYRHYDRATGREVDGPGSNSNEYVYTSVVTLRAARLNPRRRKPTEAQTLKLASLGAMRIWDLKKALRRMVQEKEGQQ